jgi:hypothetical protein
MTAPDPDVPLIRQPLNMTDEVWECAACEAPVRQGSVKHAPDCAWLAGIREQAAADERERWLRWMHDEADRFIALSERSLMPEEDAPEGVRERQARLAESLLAAIAHTAAYGGSR